MEPLDSSHVRQIAKLAHLDLTQDECKKLQKELAAILTHVESLAGIDTDGIEPMTHAVPMDLRLRPDAIAESTSLEAIAEQAPDWEDGHFRVPHIISGQDE